MPGAEHWAARVASDLGEGAVQRRFAESRVVQHAIGGQVRRVALPVTFTPFASVRPCSARCVFCSETLVHRKATDLSATLRPGPGYFGQLKRAFAELRNLPIGLSLSGLEASDDAAWLGSVLDEVEEHERAGGRVDERVLYTNASGFAEAQGRRQLSERLRAARLSRMEVSRHHFLQTCNDGIMRFRPEVRIAVQEVFEETVRALATEHHVRLVCVMQRRGVSSAEDVGRYMEWAAGLGVRDVVFREFSRLGDEYRMNTTLRVIDAERVAMEQVLDGVVGEHTHRVQLAGATMGYYFWNVRMHWRTSGAGTEGMMATFETSDYALMKARHDGDTVCKLVFHANGNLCADWDPGTRVLLRCGDE